MPGQGGDVNTTLPIILNCVTFFLCCGLGSILSIVGFIFAMQASSAKNAGDFATAQSKAKTAMIMSFIAMGLGVVGIIISVIANVANH
jgi:hypothetical protein